MVLQRSSSFPASLGRMLAAEHHGVSQTKEDSWEPLFLATCTGDR